MPLFLLLLFLPFLFLLLLPLSLLQRYRAGVSRQKGRRWLASLNFFLLTLSVLIFLGGAAVMTFWLPRAPLFVLAGLGLGACLGFIGLALTRWEETGSELFFTPNRWLVLALTVTVAARLGYGLWRGWQAWAEAEPGGSWLMAAGAGWTLGAGALVLGYYFAYWAAVRRRLAARRTK